MKRILWLGPLLSVLLYATGVLATDADLLPPDQAVVFDDNPHVAPAVNQDMILSKPVDLHESNEELRDVVVATIALVNDEQEEIQVCGCNTASESCGACSQRRCETLSCRPKPWMLDRVFGSIEYLNWWSKGQDLPPLVAEGNGLPPNPILFGNQEVGDEYLAGMRSTTGMWLDDCKTTALVGRSYTSERSKIGVAGLSNGTPAFAIPFINDGSIPAIAGQPDSFVVSDNVLLQPGVPAGVRAGASNVILGGDAFYRKLYRKGCGYRIDWLAGVQYSHLDDEAFLYTTSTRTGPNRTLTTADTFDAENNYYAGELGMIFECDRGPVTIQMMGKVGLGAMNQQLTIVGYNSVNGTFTGGGIFAQTPQAGGPVFNAGEHERNEFAWSPEFNAKAIWNLSKDLQFTLGYTFIYWSEVALAGRHIDTRVNRDVLFGGPFIPGGGGGPSFRFNDTDYWVNSFDIGFSFAY